ncbi:MAG TPA: hypothetical protein PK385_08885 [Spirochaetota bacterium]|nr:hypothetical protein [Spirochaetota bacterium]HOS33356.1 hypothetical protein [Spirochaetota bacterium]HOS56157.1 hypothetical protein [Spirochaetota bacterium]HPK62708.1 hypothetical protein [Spirochaetota bacterium]HQF78578.1 hypothetical protein [Spirochaetota bacterium]
MKPFHKTFFLIAVCFLFANCYTQEIILDNQSRAGTINFDISYYDDFFSLITNIDELSTVDRLLTIILDEEELKKYFDKNVEFSLINYKKSGYQNGANVKFSLSFKYPVENTQKYISVFFPFIITENKKSTKIETFISPGFLGSYFAGKNFYDAYLPAVIKVDTFDKEILAKLKRSDKDRDFLLSVYKMSQSKDNYFFTSLYSDFEKDQKLKIEEKERVIKILKKIDFKHPGLQTIKNYSQNLPMKFKYVLPKAIVIDPKWKQSAVESISDDKRVIVFKYTLDEILSDGNIKPNIEF